MSQQDHGDPRMSAASRAVITGPDGVLRPAADPPAAGSAGRLRRLTARPWARETIALAGFLAAGIAATWPRAWYIDGRMPLGAEQSKTVWDLWWVARQVAHLGNPWFTTHLAAPVGVRLGFDTLMPLLGVVLTPVTLAFGPSASYDLLVIVAPGLAAYAMYRAARLWLPGRTGAIAAGAFFGLSGMLASQDWDHPHTAIGAVFLPLTLEMAIRLRRTPTPGRGVLLGLVVGASVLVDQELAVLAAMLAAAALIPWLLRQPGMAKLRAAAAGAVTAVVVASPQLAAIKATAGPGGPAPPPQWDYLKYTAQLPSLFAPSPRLADDGLTGLGSIYSQHASDLLGTFGVVLTALAALGLLVSWRRASARWLAAGWLGCAALALGPVLYVGSHQYVPLAAVWRGVRVSLVMPYTWLVRIPGLQSFREADRLALLGLVGAALLAGAAVDWLRRQGRPLIIVVAVLGALEAGWPGEPGLVIVPAALPALDRPIAADHSGSVVVDLPFVVRGPQQYGGHSSPYQLALATADGHPRAMSYTAGVPRRTIAGIRRHPFYSGLVAVQRGGKVTPARLAAARRDAQSLHIGWVLVWSKRWTLAEVPAQRQRRINMHYPSIRRYLAETGFRFDFQADGVLVYRPAR